RSTKRIYVRFHSREAANWYGSDKDRYDYSYTDDAMREWIEAIKTHEAKAEQVFLLFNNCHRSQGAESARRMQDLLRQLAPELELSSPMTQQIEQRTLF